MKQTYYKWASTKHKCPICNIWSATRTVLYHQDKGWQVVKTCPCGYLKSRNIWRSDAKWLDSRPLYGGFVGKLPTIEKMLKGGKGK